jgi:hypothetical protein
MLRWLRRRKTERQTAKALGARLYLAVSIEACASQGCGHCALKVALNKKMAKDWKSAFEANGNEAELYAP